MDYHSLYQKSVLELRKIAKENRVRVPAGTSKAMIVQLILEGVEHEGDTSVVKPKSIDQEVRRASMGRPGRPPMKKESVQRGPTAAEIEQGIFSVRRPEVMPEERPAVRSSYAMRMRGNQSANGDRLYEDYESGNETWDGEADDLYAAGVVTPSAEVSQPESPAPRKRGRPRKVREESPEPPVPVVKRPRGRPRRTPLPEAAIANPEATAPQENAPVQANAEAAGEMDFVKTPVEASVAIKSEASAKVNAETQAEINNEMPSKANAETPVYQSAEEDAKPVAEIPIHQSAETAVNPVAEMPVHQSDEAHAKPVAETPIHQSDEADAKPAAETPIHQSVEEPVKPAAEVSAHQSAETDEKTTAEKLVHQNAEASARQSMEESAKSAAKMPIHQSTEAAAKPDAETPARQSAEASAKPAAEASAHQSAEAAAKLATEASAHQSAEAAAKAAAEASAHQSAEAAAKPAAEASAHQSAEAAAKPAAEVPAKQSDEVIGHQSVETTAKPAAETPTHQNAEAAAKPAVEVPASNSTQNAAQQGRAAGGYVRRSFGNSDTYRPAVLNGNAANRQSTSADGVRRPSLPRQRFENARYNPDQRAENSRYNPDQRAENPRYNPERRTESPRYNSDQRAETSRGNYTDQRTESPRGNYNDQRTETPRGNYSDQRTESPRGNYNDQRAESPRYNSDRREDATAQSSDLVYRDDPVQRTLQAQRAVNYENGLRRMENESFNPQSAEFADGAGLLEIQPDGYGFLRAEKCLPGSKDVYISIAQIRRFGLRPGDFVEGKTRPQREGDRYSALVYINRVNGEPPELAAQRKPFESLVPWYPTERLRMENPLKSDISMRMIDIVAPIGKGQRGMIVSQPKAGKTTLLKKIANSIADNNPEVKLIVLLIDERPEEVTDMKRSIRGDVIYSTFDSAPENHARVSEMVLAHAQRLVESGKDVVILLDSITRLARAYNLTIPPTGRSLSGGLDPGALYKPKKFFGAARNIENGGSLTIIATALVDTGSRMDDIIFEEFKGTGNMELHLDRRLSDKRIFPAIDLLKSGTRREELLLKPEEREGEYQVRRMLTAGGGQQSTEQLISLMEKTANNVDFFRRLKGWMAVYEKEGFTLGGRPDRG